MEAIGLIGIIVALAFLAAAIYRGYSLVIAAPLATMIVILFNRRSFPGGMFGAEGSSKAGLASFILGNFPVFLLGAILAKYMDKSGAALSIAEKLMAIVGTSSPYRALVSLFVIASALTFGGVNVFVVIFILIPMAVPIFRQYNISWALVIIPIFGRGATYTMTMMPGSPSLHNVVPSNALGTPLTAAPLVGIVTSLAAIAFLLIYMKVALARSQKRGEVFEADVAVAGSDLAEREKPPFLLSVLTIATLLVLILALSAVPKIIIYALMVAIVMSALLFRRYVIQKEVVNQGTGESITSILATGSTIAFGSFAVGVPAFGSVFMRSPRSRATPTSR